MQARTSASSSKLAQAHSCQRCAVRKVRCDKQQPCTACLRHNVECEYRTPPPPRRRTKASRDDLLNKRSAVAERPQQRHDPDAIASRGLSAHSPSSLTTEHASLTAQDTSAVQVPHSTTATPIGFVPKLQRSKYLFNGLWTRMADSIAEPEEALGHSSDEDGDEDDDATVDNTDFLLGLTPSSIGLDTTHPPDDHILVLWQIYRQNVDPLTKVVHCPSLQVAIQKAILDLSSLPKGFEALLFAIYSAAVVTLENHECERRFGESRKVLLSRYRLATRMALSRAKFMSSNNLVVLQAFLIHLVSMLDVYDSRTLWTLTGTALRIAEGMNLNEDGSLLNFSPFEAEIRRRVWWQLKLIEGDSAELSGSDKFNDFDVDARRPQFPANVDDDQLDPSLSSPPAPIEGVTDVVFCDLRCFLRFKLRTYMATNNPVGSPADGRKTRIWDSYGSSAAISERDKTIDEVENILETKYIRYYDPSQPIRLMAALLARIAVSTMRFINHHPRTWGSEQQIPDSERQYVWDLSLKSLKQYNMIHSSHDLKRFGWHAGFWFRWPSFIHIIDTLRANPLMPEAAQVWQVVDQVYEGNPEFVTTTKKAMYVAVANLCLKAYNAYENALAQQGQVRPARPWYIKTFCKQREAAIARRKDREAVKNAKRSDDEGPVAMQHVPTDNHFVPQHLQQNPPPYTPGPRQIGLPGGGGSTVHSSGPEVDQSNGYSTFTDDVATMDIDALLALDTSLEDPIYGTIDWVKWDALISDYT